MYNQSALKATGKVMNDFGFYFRLGWEHVMTIEALDHIFFIMALSAIYLLRDWKQVLILITAFTLGHGITLALSTLQVLEVPTEWVEFAVPCTIVVTAAINLFQKDFTPRTVRINYILALFFGLIHGLAFANTLRMILASDQSFALSLFSFSLGLEAGQVLVVILILLLSHLFVGLLGVNRREWVLVISAAVMALALQMAIERWPSADNRRGEMSIFHNTERHILNG
jgi:hypothetical protein